MKRSDLRVDVFYRSLISEFIFFTPDGIGGYWYDTLEEAIEQHGDEYEVLFIDNVPEN